MYWEAGYAEPDRRKARGFPKGMVIDAAVMELADVMDSKSGSPSLRFTAGKPLD